MAGVTLFPVVPTAPICTRYLGCAPRAAIHADTWVLFLSHLRPVYPFVCAALVIFASFVCIPAPQSAQWASAWSLRPDLLLSVKQGVGCDVKASECEC
ncbi:unnamed protein product [Protopolystoma xenopodis]|uniref:Uncharacterized protein n=1 Tax=Protopolystoma xenopodis TaxID=117903 RepID=A0A3S5B7P0_9PLAT|nr:unnamed protein product [Protopolystoma xenopodis]